MRKFRYISLFFLFSVLCELVYSQGFDDLKQAKQVKLNTKLQALLDKNDLKGLEKLLKSKPETKEEGSRMGKNDKGASLVIPFFYDVVERTLNGEVSLDICRLAFQSGCDIYTIYNGKTPIYRLMDYLATTPSADTQVGNEVLDLFFSMPDFDINRRYRSLPPPFSYLLSENFKFLGNQYSGDYLSIDLIFKLIDTGALLNTYDENGASLLLLANTTGNVRLQNYLVDNGVNIHKSANAAGDDAVVSAIVASDVALLSRIVKNYDVKLVSVEVKDHLPVVSADMYDYLASECARNAHIYEELVNFRNIFSDKKPLVQDKYEALARQEVAEASSYDMISLCAIRYPDLFSIVEPKRRLIAEKECDAAGNYTELSLFRDHYPQYEDLRNRCFERVSTKELGEVNHVRLVKEFEIHYPERYQDVQPKKIAIYESDCNSVDHELERVLSSCSNHNLSIQQDFDLNTFSKYYSNYYDPQNKVPLVNVLIGYYSAIEAANKKFPPYYTATNEFDDKYRSDMNYLNDAQSCCSRCLNFEIPANWLRSELEDLKSLLTSHYEQCKRDLKTVENMSIRDVPSPRSRRVDGKDYYFRFSGSKGEFTFTVTDYSNYETGYSHFVVHAMKGGKISFVDGYGSLEDAVLVGFGGGYYGFKRDVQYVSSLLGSLQQRLDIINAKQSDDLDEAIESWFK